MSPDVAVVVPLYKQSQYLYQSVLSAAHQHGCSTSVIIVNDGCPDPNSDHIARLLRDSHGKNIYYIKKTNGGLSSARNAGINFALRQFPDTQYLFMLDADNIVGSDLFERSIFTLQNNNSASWVYSPLRTFGAETATWYSTPKFNAYRQLFENQCDAGCLYRRSLFDSGLFFDERLRRGYEDWEFFARAASKGFYGIPADGGEFFYRVKFESMLTDAKSKHDEILNEIQSVNCSLFQPNVLLASEHTSAPRFMIVDVMTQRWTCFSNPNQIIWRSQLPQHGTALAPILIYTSEPHVTTLKNLGLLNPILFILQEAVAFDYVGIAPIKSGTGITLKATRGGDFIMLAAETRSFVACARDMRDMSALVRSSVRFTLETGNTPPDILQVPVSVAALKKAVVKQRQIPLAQVDDHHGGSKKDWYIPGIQAFSWHKHVALLDTVYPAPDIEGPRIAFFVPWLRLGGVDQCVTQLARNIRQIDCKANLLLILTDENSVTNDEAYALFDEIVPVAHIGEERRSKVCEVIASHCDLSINAHSTTAYKSLRLRHAKPKSLKFGRAFSYLHVIDEDTFGKPCGHAMEAANRDVMLDGHIVISNHMRSFLINKGVHSNRIVVAPNAPIVTPASHEEALALADEKSEVDYSSARPLRILFAGRLDHQKGLERLVETIRLSHQAKLNARFTILGSAVMSRTIPLFSQTQNCEILPATHDRAQLLTHFQETDVFLLLSRWEGVPLSILDAMACGAVVVATDVGAVSEVVHGNVNGYLIRNGDDKTVATQALDLLRMIIHNSAGCTNIRRAAVATAFSRSWRDTAETILGLVRAQ